MVFAVTKLIQITFYTTVIMIKKGFIATDEEKVLKKNLLQFRAYLA